MAAEPTHSTIVGIWRSKTCIYIRIQSKGCALNAFLNNNSIMTKFYLRKKTTK